MIDGSFASQSTKASLSDFSFLERFCGLSDYFPQQIICFHGLNANHAILHEVHVVLYCGPSECAVILFFI